MKTRMRGLENIWRQGSENVWVGTSQQLDYEDQKNRVGERQGVVNEIVCGVCAYVHMWFKLYVLVHIC